MYVGYRVATTLNILYMCNFAAEDHLINDLSKGLGSIHVQTSESITLQNLPIMLLAFSQFSAFHALLKYIMLIFCVFFVQRNSSYDKM